MLQYAEPVLNIPHDLTVILLVLLKKLGILFHLVVHLPGEGMNLILERGVKVMKFLLELKKGLEDLIVRGGPLGQKLKNPENSGKTAEGCHHRDQDQRRRLHEGIILNGQAIS
jgi:hypothetical protein